MRRKLAVWLGLAWSIGMGGVVYANAVQPQAIAEVDPKSEAKIPLQDSQARREGSIPTTLSQSMNPTGTRQVIGRDDRAPVLSTAYPWSAIGRLEQLNPDGTVAGFCTGTLVGKDLVLTNAHCVINPRTNQATRRPLRFRPNLIANTAKTEAFGIRVRYGERGMSGVFGPNDWALLKLDKNLGEVHGTLGWQNLSVTELKALGTKIRLIGYSGDFPKDTPGGTAGVARSCKILEDIKGFLRHNCDTFGGASGGPILAVINNRPVIVAVHAGTLGKENRAVKVSNWAASAAEMQ